MNSGFALLEAAANFELLDPPFWIGLIPFAKDPVTPFHRIQCGVPFSIRDSIRCRIRAIYNISRFFVQQ